MRVSPLFLAVALPTALAGCASVPDLGTAPEPRAPATLASTQTLAPAPSAPRDWPAASWWTGFGDPQLTALIAEALKASPDVAAAAARIGAADALVRQSGAAGAPSLTVDGFAGGNKQSKNLGIPPQFVPDGIQDTGRLTATARFDLDLWGKNRAALAAATSEAEAARVDADQAKLLLATGIAAAYAELAQYHAERDVALAALRVRGASATLTAQRVEVGVDLVGAQRQAESRVPAARADVAALDEAIALTRNRIAALVGAGPDRGLSITRPTLAAATIGVPDGAGIDLIGRRPDIVAARLRAEAAAKRIKVARADFYPNVNLSAIVGLQSLGLGRLFQGNSSYGNAGPAFSLPIFDGGAIKGRYVQARATYDGAVAQYDGTLLTALREAADAVASQRALDLRLAEQRASLAAAADASRIAALRYRGGLSNQLTVLSANDYELGARRAVVDLEARRIALKIALIRALGGGYTMTKDGDEVMAEDTSARESQASSGDDHPAPPTAGKRKKLLTILAIVVLIGAIGYGLWYFLTQSGRVHTDNAYVGADSAQVTSLVSGAVTEVRVGGTQVVRKGDVLVVIDAADAKIDLATAEAAVRNAQQKFGQTAALAGSARAKVTSRGADIAQARARLTEANATLARTRIDLDRRQQLVGSGAASGEELTTARAAYQSALAGRQLAQAAVTSAIATQASAGEDAQASEALVRGTTVDSAPDVSTARARLDKARLDLARTVIRAPIDGVVTNRQVQIGQRIAAGAPIMTIVPVATAYVDANFKESQLRRVKVGQPVELTSDFYGDDVTFHGRVTGFAGGTGAAFSLIPAQNATGNWVKVVQRLPVRVALDPNDLRAHPLRVGLSMDAIIDTREK